MKSISILLLDLNAAGLNFEWVLTVIPPLFLFVYFSRTAIFFSFFLHEHTFKVN